jgi:hypothetical protein
MEGDVPPSSGVGVGGGGAPGKGDASARKNANSNTRISYCSGVNSLLRSHNTLVLSMSTTKDIKLTFSLAFGANKACLVGYHYEQHSNDPPQHLPDMISQSKPSQQARISYLFKLCHHLSIILGQLFNLGFQLLHDGPEAMPLVDTILRLL